MSVRGDGRTLIQQVKHCFGAAEDEEVVAEYRNVHNVACHDNTIRRHTSSTIRQTPTERVADLLIGVPYVELMVEEK